MAGDTGAPGFIPLYDDDTSFAPIQDPFNANSQAVNAALKKSAYVSYATLATLKLPANVGTIVGQHATVNADPTAANNGDYTWSGTAWVRPLSTTYGYFVRPTTNTYTLSSYVSMGTLTITAAPPGVYKIDVNLLVKNTVAATGTMRVLGDGTNLNGDTPCDSAANAVVAAGGSWSGFMTHVSGDLTVALQHNMSGGSPSVQMGTSIAAHLISRA